MLLIVTGRRLPISGGGILIALAARLAAAHQVAATPNNKPTTWTAMTFTMVIDGKIIA